MRDPEASPNLIDLSCWFNVNAQGNYYGAGIDKALRKLLTGIHTMSGTAFDVRGIVQLSGSTHTSSFPARVNGISVTEQFQRIHFLHGAIGGQDEPIGTVIGKYVLHYEDGELEERLLVLGHDLLDCRGLPKVADHSTLTVAWSSEVNASLPRGNSIQLYRTTWENPRPNVKVAGLDFVSVGKNLAPFLVAITVE